MKYSLHVICVSLLGAASLLAAPRTWTNVSGQTIEAELVELQENSVRLKLVPSGRFYNLEISQLSDADKTFIAEERARKAEVAKTTEVAKRSGDWTEDWDKAQAEAKETGLPMLLLFTGSDWCPPCKALEANVFESREFKKFAKEKVVLMKADFPNGSQRAAIKKQNAELKAKFPISGYPTVFLLDSDLKELHKQVGYGGTDPKDYVKDLESKLK